MNTDKSSLEAQNQPSCLGAVMRSIFPKKSNWIDIYMFEDSGKLPNIHNVIQSRIDYFESISHTYEAHELKQALNSIQKLIPPIMFQINER